MERSREQGGGWTVVLVLMALLAVIGGLIAWGWSGDAPTWTGLGAPADEPTAKTLWDWLQLLVVPAVLALGALWVNYTQKNTEIDLAEQARNQERQIATDRQQEAALAAYYDRMTDLLLNHGLRESADGTEVRSIARAVTLAVLRGLDGGRRTQAFRFLFEARLITPPEPVIDLTGAELSDVDLSGMNLTKFSLSSVRLVRARLSNTNLTEADMSFANLSGARLDVATLSHTQLVKADLSGAELAGAKLVHADLPSTRLANASLSWVDLSEANLAHADLQSANLTHASLIHADLTQANLKQANLTEANLTAADLSYAQFAGARLTWVNMQHALLHDVDLTGLDLSQTDLQEATYTPETWWPEGFDPRAAGARLTQERSAKAEG